MGGARSRLDGIGIKSRIRRLERAAEKDMITFKLRGGSEARFYHNEVWPACLLHEHKRSGRHFDGEEPGPAHPFVEALRSAVDPTSKRCYLAALRKG